MVLKDKEVIQGCTNFLNEDIWLSNSAIKHRINNKPSETQIELITEMFQVTVQPLRTLLGVPLKVNSCFRSVKLNQKVGGERYSDHLALEDTCAIDIDESVKGLSEGITNLEIARKLIASDIPFFKLVLEFPEYKGLSPSWLHISYSTDPSKHNERIIYGVSKNNPGKYIKITNANKKEWGL